jgi:hypothetical protein
LDPRQQSFLAHNAAEVPNKKDHIMRREISPLFAGIKGFVLTALFQWAIIGTNPTAQLVQRYGTITL